MYDNKPSLPSVQPLIPWVTHTPPVHPFPPPIQSFPPPVHQPMPPSLSASCQFCHLRNLQRVMHPYNQAPVNLVHHPGGGNNIRGFGSPMQSQQHGYHVQHGYQVSFHMEYGRWGYEGGIASPSVPAHLSHEQGHRPFVQFQQVQAATPVLQEIPTNLKHQSLLFIITPLSNRLPFTNPINISFH